MSVDVGDAVWTIKGDTKPIENALQQGTARVKSATDNIVANTRKIGIGMIAVGTAVTGSLVGLVKHYANAGDEIQKMAQRTGMSTEMLSEFKHVAELSGTTLPALETGFRRMSKFIDDARDEADKANDAFGNKMSAAIQKGNAAIQQQGAALAGARHKLQQMTQSRGVSQQAIYKQQQRVHELTQKYQEAVTSQNKTRLAMQQGAEQTGTYAIALQKLGLRVSDFKGLQPEQAFMKLVGALDGVKDETTKAAIAQELFGRTGTALLPILNEGVDGINRMRQEARDLGIVFDQEACDAAAQFNDDMLRIRKSLESAGFAIAKDLVPWIDSLIPKITKAVQAGVQWIRANQGTITTIAQIAFQLGPVLVALGTLLVAVPKVIGVFKGITAVAGFFKTGFALILAGGPVTIAIAAVAAAAMLIIANWEKLGPFFSDLWSALVDTVVNAAEAIYYALRFPYDLVVGLIEKLGSLMGFDWTGIPGGFDFGQYQSGGIIREPFALVGEHGPELITGAQGARVHSASDTAQMLKGGGTTIEHIEINVDTGGAPVNADRLASELEYALGRRLATVGVTA